MAGFGIGLAYNVFPAEFGQISQNIVSNMQMAAQGFSESEYKKMVQWKATSVDGEKLKPDEDRDADGHPWAPPRRKHQTPEAPPKAHRLQQMAGDGAVLDLLG